MRPAAQFSDGSGRSLTLTDLQPEVSRTAQDLQQAGWREGMSAILIAEPTLKFVRFLLAAQKLQLHIILMEPKSPELVRQFQDKVHGLLHPDLELSPPHHPASLLFEFSGPTLSICTSGSTGTPKLITLDQQTLRERSEMECEIFGITEDSRLLCVMPPSYEMGLNQIFSALHAGASLVMSKPLFPQSLLQQIKEHQIDGLIATPQFWMNLVNRIDSDLKPERPLNWLSISGGRVSSEIFQKIKALFPEARIFHTYGKTETGRSLYGLCENELVLNRFPKGVHVDLENGELIHRGYGLTLLSDGQRETRHATGDLFRQQSDGNFIYEGRRDNVVKYLDRRIHLEEIENALTGAPGVLQAACLIENSHSNWETDQILVAYIEATENFSIQAVKESLHDRLSSYKVPRAFRLIKNWPLTRSLKIDRTLLPKGENSNWTAL